MARAAVLWSGGKDSALALHRAAADGIDVRVLFNIYDAASGRVRFHGVGHELIAAQAASLHLELLQLGALWPDYERVFVDGLDTLRELGIDAIVLGNIHLEDVRAWYEQRTTSRGFRHVEPLWGLAPADVLRAFARTGWRARVTCIDPRRVPRAWLGAEVDDAFVDAVLAEPGIDAAGETGEFHTFVYDGPTFRSPLRLAATAEYETEGYLELGLEPRRQ